MNHKRGKPREKVRCTLCTDGRENIGGDRQRREQEALDYEESASGDDGSQTCPDCKPPGSGKCDDCPDGICVLCGGTGVYDFS